MQREDLAARGGALDDEKAASASMPAAAESRYRQLFEDMLDQFASAQVKLVVLEVEEAPYTYRHPAIRRAWRDFMRRNVEPLVTARGFKYVRTDWDAFDDADYFDFNHLNSRGASRYTEQLVAALGPLLGGRAARRPD